MSLLFRIPGLAPSLENELAGHKWVCMEVEALVGRRRTTAGSTSSIPNQVLCCLRLEHLMITISQRTIVLKKIKGNLKKK